VKVESYLRGRWLADRNGDPAVRPGRFTLFGLDWLLDDAVFAPISCESTRLFTEWLPFPVGGSFLEVGCGAGVTSVMAARAGCVRVVAVDVSADAFANTVRNVALHDLSDRVEVLLGDLFEPVGAEHFDVVYWNSNFIDTPDGFVAETGIEQAIFDPGYRTHRRFLAGLRARLAPGGRAFLGFSTLGSHDLLDQQAADMGWMVHTRRASEPGLVPGFAYQLLELESSWAV